MRILLSMYLFIYLFSLILLPNIKIKTNNHFNLEFIHKNTKNEITKLISIHKKIEMETSYLFSFPLYQTPH